MSYVITNNVNAIIDNINGYTGQHIELIYASLLFKKYKILDILLKYVDINSTNIVGDSLLHMAIDFNDYEMAKRLFLMGISPNIQNKSGYTPMHYLFISRCNHYSFVKLMLDHGAKISIKNNFGEIPVQYMNDATYNYMYDHFIVKIKKIIAKVIIGKFILKKLVLRPDSRFLRRIIFEFY
jgi:ankyrin repeat protein